jgi:hypothetical protein
MAVGKKRRPLFRNLTWFVGQFHIFFHFGRKEMPAEVWPAASLIPMMEASHALRCGNDIGEIYRGYMESVIIIKQQK